MWSPHSTCSYKEFQFIEWVDLYWISYNNVLSHGGTCNTIINDVNSYTAVVLFSFSFFKQLVIRIGFLFTKVETIYSEDSTETMWTKEVIKRHDCLFTYKMVQCNYVSRKNSFTHVFTINLLNCDSTDNEVLRRMSIRLWIIVIQKKNH